MPPSRHQPFLPHLAAGQAFPPVDSAWPSASDAPGLLASGGALDVPTLRAAYAQGIFPWFGHGQPVLWWSTDPRMALQTHNFRLHKSLRRVIARFMRTPDCALRMDTAFAQVIGACAGVPRNGQRGTWIVPAMQAAYLDLHRAGHAHSVEVWAGGELVAGLYCVCVGCAVFGESMFTHVADGSKIALAALVAFCRAHGMPMIDCQQETPHLAFMGAAPMPRAAFVQRLAQLVAQSPQSAGGQPQGVGVDGRWHFHPIYWKNVLPPTTHERLPP